MKKATLFAIIAILSILCFAQAPWTTTFDYYDLGLDTLFSDWLCPSLTPWAIHNTQDGIIVVANGKIYEHYVDGDITAYFTFVFKTDFGGNILWTSCDDAIGGTDNLNVPYIQITGGLLLDSFLLADGSVATLQREGIFIRNGATGEITASISNQDNHHKTLAYIPEINQLCHAVIDYSNIYLRYYDGSDLHLIQERVIYSHLVDGVCETIKSINQKNENIYILGTYDIGMGYHSVAIYMLDLFDNYTLITDDYINKFTIADDGSIFAIRKVPPNWYHYIITNYTPTGERINSLGFEDEYLDTGIAHFEFDGDSFYLNEYWTINPYIPGFSRISKYSISDFGLQSHFQFLEEGIIAYSRRTNGFYAVGEYYNDFHLSQPIKNMTLSSINDSQMPIEKEKLPLPTQYLTCYPNPFNPKTTLEFTLTEPAQTELSVYNIKGQLVKSLITQRLQSGVHKVSWDGQDNSGHPSSSGVYFFKLSYGNEIAIKKATLLK
ncbi:MAG: T9SS type A sorting domain-containing protein [Candidatus Cloacimonetes bacterium]|nr:T9SS type A sorting domain-containing protein [Candidatus Cloacimonadota bacterium]